MHERISFASHGDGASVGRHSPDRLGERENVRQACDVVTRLRRQGLFT